MPRRDRRNRLDVSPLPRLLVSIVVGIVAGIAISWQSTVAAVLGGWAATAFVFVGWTWVALFPMDADETRRHAQREDRSRAIIDSIVLVAAVASLAGVLLLIGPASGKGFETTTVLVSIVASWLAMQTVFALRYTRVYMADETRPIDFHMGDRDPVYSDFAYLAATIGVSFAVSDSDLGSSALRRVSLVHQLLAFVFGTVIISIAVGIISAM